ncbi:8090_t:CDS:2 [Ambispora leptoticha]|uniref:Mitotic-spindle organizing protein 1 n=1 Tax=Ambispora leptoticha TaxID=144679 RepID=A0A9N8VIB4_9GLOM|nr:8090_t:CDS:2 [Ambispora leptoticha]
MENPKIQEARETLDVLHEIATILNANVDRETISLCVQLCEEGVNPEALAAVVKELRRESYSNKVSEGATVTASSTAGGENGGATTTSSASGSKN